MRGSDVRSGKLFSYVDLEERVPVRHPLRAIREIVNEALAALGGQFQAIYSDIGRPSIPPEQASRLPAGEFRPLNDPMARLKLVALADVRLYP